MLAAGAGFYGLIRRPFPRPREELDTATGPVQASAAGQPFRRRARRVPQHGRTSRPADVTVKSEEAPPAAPRADGPGPLNEPPPETVAQAAPPAAARRRERPGGPSR